MEETLGKRIIANRKRLGMTQDKLAEQLGVTAQAVSKWENDQSCPDITMLPKLAELFGISIDALLGCETQKKVYEAMPEKGKISSDKIIASCSLSAREVMSSLTILELYSVVQALPGDLYKRLI